MTDGDPVEFTLTGTYHPHRPFFIPLHEQIQRYIDSLDVSDHATSRVVGQQPTRLKFHWDEPLAQMDPVNYLEQHKRGDDPDHEAVERLPKGCLACGEEDLGVRVTWNGDGEIDSTRLRCETCGWTVTGTGGRKKPPENVNWLD